MEIKIASASSPQGLTQQIKVLLEDGWQPMGSHKVTNVHSQNRYRGDMLTEVVHEAEYSITMGRNTPNRTISVDVAYYHPNDNETIKVYDAEGMREEFELKLSEIINTK